MSKKIISIVIIVTFLVSGVAFGDAVAGEEVVSLGQDLTEAQKTEMKNYFGVTEDVRIIEVTNEEERKYFGEHIDLKIIGTRALSSVYVQKLEEGEGIEVESNNITWVTDDMYENALVTVGVKDAKVRVNSPMKVTGTAALTGIIKAFEDMSGEDISETAKEVASEELAKTSELGKEIGKEEATNLINEIKIYIINNNITNINEIKEVVEDKSKELNINLTQDQIDEISKLMKNIAGLDLNLDEIKTQLKGLGDRINKIIDENPEAQSFFAKILNAIKDFFNSLFN
ncbi:DUF1002 domain-containing protein [Clostridium sp. D2Q-11]|uniref:DUF1002 domain-containing protein n=1 Tax=Anaeromonas frigoriresistens TaxID=2683708 RepID=A0A942Z6V2_9FIRM|nr:DUF1002 domain-containing protein [Anaeromonas frigoriresistens]MBS4538866.1 DUF1002 domain-containing protein [Anaeromonas frigoriresistens]